MNDAPPMNGDTRAFISQYDLIYEDPPVCWQDGLLLGNGSLGAVFFAAQCLEWIVNKTDVLDGRVRGVSRIIPPDEAAAMVKRGASARDFQRAERGDPAPEGIGPKSCCRLLMDLGFDSSDGRAALPDLNCRLRLHDATLAVALDKHLFHPRVESFVRADEDTLVIQVRDVSPLVGYHTRLFFGRPDDLMLRPPRVTARNGRLVLRMEMPEAPGYAAGLLVVPRAGIAYRQDLLPRLRQKYRAPETGSVDIAVKQRQGLISVGGDFDVFVTVVTSRDAADPVAELHRRLDAAAGPDVEEMRRPHARWWEDYWRRSWVELGDKAQEQLFYHSLYVLGSTYRKAPLAGLCGLSYGPGRQPVQATPWTGDLHHDLNIQCPFFPVHALNHSDLFDPYLDTYDAFLPEARRLAREVFDAPGAHFDMCFNATGKSVMGGVGAYRFYYGGSYLGLMHCLCWRYRRDANRMRDRIYPFLKEILAFYLHRLKPDAQGMLHLWPAYAPELDVMDCADPVQVISMLKICLATAVEGARVLGADADLATRWQDVLGHLPAYPQDTDSRGRRVVVDGVGIPADHQVGQAGCLHPVYPCGEVDEFADPQTLALYGRTLDSVADKSAEKSYAVDGGFYYQCVWQCFFRAMTALRLGRSGEFWQFYLPMLLRAYTKPNGLLSHDAAVIIDPAASEANLAAIPDVRLLDVGETMPPFEPWCGHHGGSTPARRAKEFSIPLVEATSDYLTMMVETLLQSHNGIIRVFPAWPAGRDAQFARLVAEGRVFVSARQRAGRVDFVRLERPADSLPGDAQIKLKSPWTGAVQTIELAAGRSLLLTPDGAADGVPCQEPGPVEAARPRIIWQDRNGALWLGRRRQTA